MKGDSSSVPELDPCLLVLLCLCAANLFIVARPLTFGDMIVGGFLVGGDAPDWIANGLFLAGEDVRYSARTPLLPLLIAMLYRANLLWLLPVALQLLVHAVAVCAYVLFRRSLGGAAALLLSLAWLFNANWQNLSLEVMADVPATCLLGAGIYWLQLRDAPRSYVGAGLLLGLSALVQPVALLAAPAALAAVLAHRRVDLRTRELWAGLFLLIVPTLVWTWAKVRLTGVAGDVLYRHWSLVGFQWESVAHYLFGYVSMIGVPAALLATAGLAVVAARSRRNACSLFATVLFVFIAAFFTLFYGFRSHRFLLYLLPLSYMFVAEMLRRIRVRSMRVSIAAIVLLWSAIPYAHSGYAPDRIAVWPLPVVYVAAPTGVLHGSPRVDPFRARLERPAFSAVLSGVSYVRLHRNARRDVLQNTVTPLQVREDISAVYFYEDEADAGRRDGIMGTRGNRLLKRVKVAPFSAFAESWTGFDLTRIGRLGPDAVYRVRVPDERAAG